MLAMITLQKRELGWRVPPSSPKGEASLAVLGVLGEEDVPLANTKRRAAFYHSGPYLYAPNATVKQQNGVSVWFGLI